MNEKITLDFYRHDDYGAVLEDVLSGYDEELYEDNDMNVTEEEFVFDTLNNVRFAQQILSARKSNIL